MVKIPMKRLVLWWGILVLVGVLLLLFAGLGYFLLVFALWHAISNISIYSDSVYIALMGREYHSAQAEKIAKSRASKAFKMNIIFVVLSNIAYFALAFYIIFQANIKLVSF